MSEDHKVTTTDEKFGGDVLRVVEVEGKKTGAPIDIANFMENEHVKALLEAENVDTLFMYIQDKNLENMPPAVSMCSGNVEHLGQCLIPLIRSCIEHDPARLLVFHSILMDVMIRVIDQHFRTIKYPIEYKDPINDFKEDCLKAHNVVRELLGKMGYMEFIGSWVRVMIETANEESPEVRDKVLNVINNTFSYNLYKNIFESNQRGN